MSTRNASWAFIKGKQSLSLPLSILADHIGKIPKEARVFAYAIPPINRVGAIARRLCDSVKA